MVENQENFQDGAPDKGEVEMAQQEAQPGGAKRTTSKGNEIYSQLTGEQKNTSKVGKNINFWTNISNLVHFICFVFRAIRQTFQIRRDPCRVTRK